MLIAEIAHFTFRAAFRHDGTGSLFSSLHSGRAHQTVRVLN
jgi:hypothetical protein